jgi:hypothetical protein
MQVGSETGQAGWQDAEVAAANIPDKRLQRRLQRLLEQLSAAPGKPVPAACGDWAATKAAYRFFDNPRVTEHGVLSQFSVEFLVCTATLPWGTKSSPWNRPVTRLCREPALLKMPSSPSKWPSSLAN